jgi:hypothetical protein
MGWKKSSHAPRRGTSTGPGSRSAAGRSAAATLWTERLLTLGLGAGALFLAAVWLVPIEVAQVWAQQRAGGDPYAQFEAIGQAEALMWFFRCAGPAGLCAWGWCWWHPHATQQWVSRCFNEWWQLAAGESSSAAALGDQHESKATSVARQRDRRRWFLTASVGAMLVLAGVHWCGAIGRRAAEWPYYRLRSGPEVLPNISESNRAVIRYLREATPENSRIFVVSDQKLFFVSYYLLPRVILHRMHPEAEHIIPRAHQQRQLAAYRWSDVPKDRLTGASVDFLLEYFEGPEYIEPGRATEDTAWTAFIRQWQRDPSYVPPYTVVLRPWSQVAP